MSSTDATRMAGVKVFRVEVRPNPGEPDPRAEAALAQAKQDLPGVTATRSAAVYLIEAPLDADELEQIAGELLGDPVSQFTVIGAEEVADAAAVIEVHYLPGVMDPVAQSTREAILEMIPHLADDPLEVRTAVRYDLTGTATPRQLEAFARRHLANPVIQSIHLEPYLPPAFVHGRPYELKLAHVAIRDLDDESLRKLSRQSHLFLSLEEMQAIQSYYRNLPGAAGASGGREPTDVELETLAQTWSEHCVHKTLKSRIHYSGDGDNEIFRGKPGHTINPDGSVTIDNLLKSTVAAATNKLMQEENFRDWCISVFVDNAGVVKFDDEDAVCIKVETHNHPSAIEPYGGAATGIGGVIRDVLGTGLAARPIANTDVFCVAPPPPEDQPLPKGVIHPRRILQGVVAGVRDYGNRMGIPTVNGAVYFHDDFVGNPLVFAGCVGLIPLDKCFGDARPGDRIIALGGRTGRDGIHGATFSSAELTDSHADEFSHAVQIGNAITEKKLTDVILLARDRNLFHAITDCGAGGFSSAVGEMGETVGATVHLERAPLKYAGLSYTEIWISEAQERMVLAVPPEHVEELRKLCNAEDVELSDLGEFGLTDGDTPTLSLNYHGAEVGRLSMTFLHHGIPQPVRAATWSRSEFQVSSSKSQVPKLETLNLKLETLLSHPNIASKHWIIRQYDHEVQGGSVVKPLVGPHQDGPSDAAVLRPKLNTHRGIALACGLAPHFSETTSGGDSYSATLAAIDEAVRNAVCVGADPQHIAILDNFCWPSCDDPRNLGSLVRAAEACYDGALAYRTPFVSGKDSLNNQFTTDDGRVIAIPPTLLITALGIVPDVRRCVTMDAKQPGHTLLLVGNTTEALGGSHYAQITGATGDVPTVDLTAGPRNARAVASLIAHNLLAAAHDCSDGGLLVAAAEMAFAGRVGLDLQLDTDLPLDAACFAETPSRYLLEVADPRKVEAILDSRGVPHTRIGTFADHDRLTLADHLDASLDDLRHAWLAPLDW